MECSPETSPDLKRDDADINGTPATQEVTFEYDSLGRRKTVTDRRGGVTTCGYTPGGQVSALTDAENQVTLYDYNARGEKIRETCPDHVNGAAVGTAGYGIVEFSDG